MRKTICVSGALCLASALVTPVWAGEAPPADVKNLPANQWVDRPLSGWKGKEYYGRELCYGFAAGATWGWWSSTCARPAGPWSGDSTPSRRSRG